MRKCLWTSSIDNNRNLAYRDIASNLSFRSGYALYMFPKLIPGLKVKYLLRPRVDSIMCLEEVCSWPSADSVIHLLAYFSESDFAGTVDAGSLYT
jgi:hypothetical protein